MIRQQAASWSSAETSVPDALYGRPSTHPTSLPVRGLVKVLPVHELTPLDFERLCLRLAERECDVQSVNLYGDMGQAQDGIDLIGYPRDPQAAPVVYQCKRVRKLGPAALRKIVDEFCRGSWLLKASRLVVCCSASLRRTSFHDERHRQSSRLASEGVILDVWDEERISLLLKDEPNLVEDFFGPAWRDAFSLKPRLGSSLQEKVAMQVISAVGVFDDARPIFVSGAPGCDAVGFTRCALAGMEPGGELLEADLRRLTSEPLIGFPSSVVAILRQIVSGTRYEIKGSFADAWSRYVAAFRTARHARSVLWFSGYDNFADALLSLGLRGGDGLTSRADPKAALRRVLSKQGDLELVLGPHRELAAALVRATAESGATFAVIHLYNILDVPEPALLSIVRELACTGTPAIPLRVVLSADLHSPHVLAAIRASAETFHVPALPASAVVGAARRILGLKSTRHTALPDLFLEDLAAICTLAFIDFIAIRSGLLQVLSAIWGRARTTTRFDALSSALCLLATAYEVSEALLMSLLRLGRREAAIVVADLPDSSDHLRRLPLELASPIVARAERAVVDAVIFELYHYFSEQTAEVKSAQAGKPDVKQLPALYHAVLCQHDVTDCDVWLLRSVRTSWVSFSALRVTISRLLSVHDLPSEMSDALRARLHVIELIETGLTGDSIVQRYFEEQSPRQREIGHDAASVASYQIGHIAFVRGQYKTAIAALESSVLCDMEHFRAWSLLGSAYNLVNRRDDAFVALREAIKLNGAYEYAHYNLGIVLEQAKQYDAAAESYQQAILCEASFYEAIYNLSNLMLTLARFEDAARLAQYASHVAQELDIELQYNIAVAIAATGERRYGIRIFKDCFRRRPDARIAFNLALAYGCQEQWAAAGEWCKKALRGARETNDEEIATSAVRLRDAIRQHKIDRDAVSRPRVNSSFDLSTLFEHLRSIGYEAPSGGIHRTVRQARKHKVWEVARQAANAKRLRAEAAAAQAEAAGAPKGIVRSIASGKELVYVRLPSYGGG